MDELRQLARSLPLQVPDHLFGLAFWYPAAVGHVGLQVVVTGMYEVEDGVLVRAGPPTSLSSAPVHRDTPEGEETSWEASLLDESVFTPAKAWSDLAILGASHPPVGKSTFRWTCSVSIGEHSKTWTCHEPRRWSLKEDGTLVPRYVDRRPQREPVPMLFEFAYGGEDPWAPEWKPAYLDDNPVGLGYVASRRSAVDQQLPRIEDPEFPIRSWKDQPDPQASCLVPGSWGLRSCFLDLDAMRQRVDAKEPLAVDDMQWEYHNHAHPELQFPHLEGTEPVLLERFTPEGRLEFSLPGERVSCRVEMHGEVADLPMQLDTVLLFPDSEQARLTWRCMYPCDASDMGIGWHARVESKATPQLRESKVMPRLKLPSRPKLKLRSTRERRIRIRRR